jgi:hypothetical protein
MLDASRGAIEFGAAYSPDDLRVEPIGFARLPLFAALRSSVRPLPGLAWKPATPLEDRRRHLLGLNRFSDLSLSFRVNGSGLRMPFLELGFSFAEVAGS